MRGLFLHLLFNETKDRTMTHKQECKTTCIDYLASRNLSYCFTEKEFERIYRGARMGNAFSVGLDAADSMILNYKFNNSEVQLQEEFN